MKILIAGGGLAGLSLTRELLQRGAEAQLLVSPTKPSSTSVATGMYNPIVFRRINKSWMINVLEPVFTAFYDSLSEALGVELCHPIRFAKRIPSEDYARLWNQRASEAAFRPYLRPVKQGMGEVLRAGILNTGLFMERYQQALEQSGMLHRREFREEEVELSPGTIRYDGKVFDRLILAIGPHAAKSQLFGWLPFNVCKGEWIRIASAPDLTEGRVINNVLNIIPEGNGVYKLSSTYAWKNLDWTSSHEAEAELLQAFREVHDVPFTVIEQKAGLRPTVADRRPYLGRHPEYPNVFIFNGLGSKGVMLAPYFARHLAGHLLSGTPLMPEVDIARHYKRYHRTD